MTLKEYYKIRLEEQLDEGFMDATKRAATRTAGAARTAAIAGRNTLASGVKATGSGMMRLGNYMRQNPRQATNRFLGGLAAAGVVAGAYKLGQQSGAPAPGRGSSPMVGVPSGSGGGGIDEPGVRRPDGKVRRGPSGERNPWITPRSAGPTTPEP